LCNRKISQSFFHCREVILESETILVVDDNREIADFLAEKILPTLGYRAVVAYNGSSAMQVIHSRPVSLIILDLQLPDTNGLDLLHQLAREGHNIPTILSTAHGSEHVAVEAFRLGVQDYLPKPVDMYSLDAALTRALTESRLGREKAMLTEQLKEQVSWLTVLSKVGKSVTSTLELDQVLRRIIEAGVFLTSAEEGFVALLDAGTDQLYLRAAKNIEEEAIETMRMPVADSLAGHVMRSGRPLRTSRGEEDPDLKVSTGFLVQNLLHVPILSRGRALGVLSVDNRKSKRAFTESDEAQLTSLADYAAVAIENARLFEQAHQEIVERRRVEAALRESEERYALAVRGANDGIWDWNLKTNHIYYSPRWKAMLGYAEDEISDSPDEWFDRVHPEDIERLRLEISSHLQGLTPHFENEHRVLHRDRTYRWMLSRSISVLDADKVASRMAGSQADITDRKNAEQRLLHDALHDTLTELPNRALFMDRLQYAVERSKRHPDYVFAVLFLDLDRFKDVNDSLGHMAGDELLIAVGQMLRQGIRATDTVARLGGDEFVILLDDVGDENAAVHIAEWINDQFRNTFDLVNHEVFITTSIGIVLNKIGYQDPEDILRDADIAMYSAKASGRARYHIFEPHMREQVMKRISLETDLRQALDRQELRVFYQPVVSLENGRLIGFEALVRWQHPERGLLLPREFLPMAEESGIIIPLDRWVMHEACRQMHHWHQEMPSDPPLTISVNISAKQLLQPELVPVVEGILAATGLDPECLKLEITENTVMETSQLTTGVFANLQSLGVQLQIDDFGVGYSSLGYLSHFPLNALKIDRTFVGGMADDTNQLNIIQAIITLTRRLGVGLIAEGVETQGQLDQLKQLGCEFGQGFLVSVPIDSQAAHDLLKETHPYGHILAPWKPEPVDH
jgi:diguanylate cyclase (GGDEF)-like protein/PAS domain S-box-containing protein